MFLRCATAETSPRVLTIYGFVWLRRPGFFLRATFRFHMQNPVSEREQSMMQACRHRQNGGLTVSATLRPLWACHFLRSWMAWPKLVTGNFIAKKPKCNFLRKVKIFEWPKVGLGAGEWKNHIIHGQGVTVIFSCASSTNKNSWPNGYLYDYD